ncbi:hypothetical protein E3N88_02988 [Mikania micrantha]|uniref:Uncharacterized protein n=1 Tax=Mikania micrantha TaxID=192012 RepID=A0A5N6Q5H0_9ASTR|nr:hypothetical protein E3N88_02988 [Mikania micrantha]
MKSSEEPAFLVDFWMQEAFQEITATEEAETSGIWSPKSDQLITADQLRGMWYTKAMAREVSRYRAPTTLVPRNPNGSSRLVTGSIGVGWWYNRWW